MATRVRNDQEPALAETARRVPPAGSFGNPPADIIIDYGRAGRVWDISGNESVDFLLGSGPMFVGHAHPEVVAAVQVQIAHGSTSFTESEPGIRPAAEIIEAVPCAEKVRFVSSGT
jgi:glutamate-1-semialdehyde 2,1-aminomutase